MSVLLEKFNNFIDNQTNKSDPKYRNVKMLIENSLQKMDAPLKLTEDIIDYVDIDTLVPKIFGEVIRRSFYKIMMQNFVGVKTINDPALAIPYEEVIYKSTINGITSGKYYTGLPVAFEESFGGFTPFFSHEMLQVIEYEKTDENKFDLNAQEITYRDEYRKSVTKKIFFNSNDFRKLVLYVSFAYAESEEDDQHIVSGWLVYQKSLVGEGGFKYEWKFFNNYKEEKFDILEKININLNFISSEKMRLKFSTKDGDASLFTAIGQYYKVGEDLKVKPGTEKEVYYIVNPEKYPQIKSEISKQIKHATIILRDRNIKIHSSPKEEQIMKDYLGMEWQEDLIETMANQLAIEKDVEIIQFIQNHIISDLTFYVDLRNFREKYANVSFREQLEYIFYQISLLGARMESMNKQGKPNKILLPNNIASGLEHLKTFQLFEDEIDSPPGGIYKVGTIRKKYDLYVNPYAGNDEIIVCRKPEKVEKGGIVYNPYFYFTTPEIWEGESGRKTVITQETYGLTKIPFGEYDYGAIKVIGFDSI